MVAMSLWATNLVQITGVVASQIRMEIYAGAGEKMATYYYQQTLESNASAQIDEIAMYATSDDPSKRKQANHQIKVLGTTKNYPRVTGYSDPAQFTSGQQVVPCTLKFGKTNRKTEFVARIEINYMKDRNVVDFAFVGSLDDGFYGRPLLGVLIKVEGRWRHLIDI